MSSERLLGVVFACFITTCLVPKVISYLYLTLFPFKVVDAVFMKAHSTEQYDCLNYSNLHCQRFLHERSIFSFPGGK